MNLPLVFGIEPNHSVLVNSSLVQSIKNAKISYGYLGYELDKPEIDDFYLENLAKIILKESIRTKMNIWAVSSCSSLLSNTPLNKEKGYWRFQDESLRFWHYKSYNLAYEISDKIRLVSVTPIKSIEDITFFISYALERNSFLLLSEESDINYIEILNLIASRNSTNECYEDFLLDLISIIDQIDDVVIFPSGGFDYGAIYLNSLEKENDKQFSAESLTRRSTKK